MNRARVTRFSAAVCLGALFAAVFVVVLNRPASAASVPESGAPQTLSAGVVCFVVDDAQTCVDRAGIRAVGTLTDQVRSLIQAMVAGPTQLERAQGVRSALPAGAALVGVSAADDRAIVRLDLPATFLSSFDAGDAEDVNEQVATTLTPFNFVRIDVLVRDPAQFAVFRPLSTFLQPIVIPTKPGETKSSSLIPGPSGGAFLLPPSSFPSNSQPQSPGGLSGKTVFVSAGHGWYWNSTLGQYRTQRPVYPTTPPYAAGQGVVEDFNNAEAVNQYLLQYLWNAGADAWTVRERDMHTEMHIVDDTGPAFSLQGSWSSGAGGYGSGYYSSTSVTSGATATATWTFTPATAAEYAVYVWFPGVGDRTVAARYSVDHAGGTTALTITQQRDGNNWRYIGAYPFRAGVAGRVRLSNASVAAGLSVLADAIRVGGGIGDQVVGTAPTPSGKPRWEEQARQYAKWVGLPDADNLNDVIIRPIYSEWEKESGEDAVYVSWHTNGYNGYNTTARGTESYIHSFQPTTNSDRLQYWIHTELINDIHTGWEATWPDRGRKTQDFGELRLLSTMPGVLIENGYHDNPQDVEAMKDPRFALLSARAVYQGLVRYWHEQNPLNVPLVFLPEPPTHLRIRNSGPGQVSLMWQPGSIDPVGLLGDAATAYRVYTSTDGFGWGDAISTTNTALALSGLAPGQLIYVRVTGVNAGGESFPTPVLAARVASNGVAPVLIVYGFNRIDRHGLILQNDPPEGDSRRMFVDRINRLDYIIQHAPAITYAFDSALHDAVTGGDVGLGNYILVDWIAGEEQSPDVALNPTDQALLRSFLDDGGALLISGAQVGFDLVSNGVGPAFYSQVLHATFGVDDAGVHSVKPVAGSLFDGLNPITFDDGTHGTYDVDSPDTFTPIGGAASALLYNDGLDSAAALTSMNGPCSRLVYLGFPLETIYPKATRDSVMARAIDFLDACVPPPGPDTSISSPSDGAAYNGLPGFNGTAGGSNLATVQVAILSGTQYYSGSTFVPVENWLTATGTLTWSYILPPLPDGMYGLRARAFVSSTLYDVTPVSVTFVLDTIAPAAPALITPTGGISMAALAPTFVYTASGDLSGFDFALDGVTETLRSAVFSITHAVTDGQHVWRVRAFDGVGNVSDWSSDGVFTSRAFRVYLPTAVKTFAAENPVVPVCQEVVVNGGFESGLTGWTVLATNPAAQAVSEQAYAGSFSLRAGSRITSTSLYTGYSSVQQAVTIPLTATSATLSFRRYRISGDTVKDLQYVGVLSGTALLDYLVYERVDDPEWIAAQFDLLGYVGQTINLRFSVYNDGKAGATGMYIDDVSLQICK